MCVFAPAARATTTCKHVTACRQQAHIKEPRRTCRSIHATAAPQGAHVPCVPHPVCLQGLCRSCRRCRVDVGGQKLRSGACPAQQQRKGANHVAAAAAYLQAPAPAGRGGSPPCVGLECRVRGVRNAVQRHEAGAAAARLLATAGSRKNARVRMSTTAGAALPALPPRLPACPPASPPLTVAGGPGARCARAPPARRPKQSCPVIC